MLVVLPPVVFWFLMGLLFFAGVQPSDGGWPAVWISLGIMTVGWWGIFGGSVPNRLQVGPDWVARRVLLRWKIFTRSQVSDVYWRQSYPSGLRLVVRFGRRGVTFLPKALAQQPEQTAALAAFLGPRWESPTAAGVAGELSAEGVAAPKLRVRGRWLVIVTAVAVGLLALVALLRLITG